MVRRKYRGKSPAVRLMGPRLAAPEREVIGIGGVPGSRFLWLDHLVGDAFVLAIGDRLFLAGETYGELLFHVVGVSQAHERLDVARLLWLVIYALFLGVCNVC